MNTLNPPAPTTAPLPQLLRDAAGTPAGHWLEHGRACHAAATTTTAPTGTDAHSTAPATSPALAPLWQAFVRAESDIDGNTLEDLYAQLLREVQDNGISYNVYADSEDPKRPWALDLFPVLLKADEWRHITAGVQQRMELLEAIMADAYGPQQWVAQGILPAALVQGHPGYIGAMQGAAPVGGRYLHLAAFDLARGPDGHWWLLSQRTQAPSGLGYLLENRALIARLFPRAFAALGVQRLANSYAAWLDGVRQRCPLAPGETPHLALLTPGPYNETYFEHAYLASQLGMTLVQADDLSVRSQGVFLKTLQGLQRVHAILKRVDDLWLDPLELRADSSLGVPGLLQAVRAGQVLLLNPPGSGFLESNALLGFMPALAQRLLGEPLQLPAIPSWWCGEAAAWADAQAQLPDGVIKPSYPSGQHAHSFEPVLGHQLTPEQRAQWLRDIASDPEAHTIQRWLPLSHQAVWRPSDTGGGQAQTRPLVLRVFALLDAQGGVQVLPGGLARLGTREGIASMQRGGSSADVWVASADVGPSPSPGARRTWGGDRNHWPQPDPFVANLPPQRPAMGPQDGETWAAASDVAPTTPKPDGRLDTASPAHDPVHTPPPTAAPSPAPAPMAWEPKTESPASAPSGAGTAEPRGGEAHASPAGQSTPQTAADTPAHTPATPQPEPSATLARSAAEGRSPDARVAPSQSEPLSVSNPMTTQPPQPPEALPPNAPRNTAAEGSPDAPAPSTVPSALPSARAPHPASFALPPGQLRHPEAAAMVQAVTSRAAENLHWLGRYTERSELCLRLTHTALTAADDRATAQTLRAWSGGARSWDTEYDHRRPLAPTAPDLPPDGEAFAHTHAHAGSVAGDTSPTTPQPKGLLETLGLHLGLFRVSDLNDPVLRNSPQLWLRHLWDTRQCTGLAFNLAALHRAAATVRERLSVSHWQWLDELAGPYVQGKITPLTRTAQALRVLSQTNQALAAITGAQTDRMSRDDGWRMLSLGRHLERLDFQGLALHEALTRGVWQEPQGFDALLALSDGHIAYHARFAQQRNLSSLVEFLVCDGDQPRAMTWIAKTLHARLRRLEHLADGATRELAQSLPPPQPAPSDLAGLPQDPTALIHWLAQQRQAASSVASQLNALFFTHGHDPVRSVGN